MQLTLTPGAVREWRQFRLLSRSSVGRLLDSVAFSRDTDAMQFAVWGLALAMTPPLLTAIRKSMAFPFLLRLPPEIVERILIADRSFFVIYGMLASALTAALMWDALFPDRQDQEIVGALPVRARTLAAARLAATACVSVVLAAAINVPAAVLYSAGSSAHPIIGSFPRVLAAHLLATMCACAFTFFGLMALRAVVAACAGKAVADRIAILLQFVTVVLLLEVFLFLPGVLPSLVRELQGGSISHLALPPIWFVALFAYVAEGRGALTELAPLAVFATLAALTLVVMMSLLPAAMMGRRALETRPRERAGLPSIARVVAAFIRAPQVRAIFLFAFVSLVRSRRHALVLATSAGFAIAFGIVRLLSASFRTDLVFDEPRAYLLALPLAFVFFAVFGLRAAFRLPTEIDANWPFHLTPPTVRACVRASRLLILWFGAAPIAIGWLLVAASLWPRPAALWSTLCIWTLAWALTEIALVNWTQVPLASAHEPSSRTLRVRWMIYLVALYVFSYKLAEVLVLVLAVPRRLAIFVALSCGVAIAIRVAMRVTPSAERPTIDAVIEDRFETLNLSGALN